ncbi:NAD(P)/FAD-dependent oxidoreductase [Knoellia sp. p5-6-4]|uniref:FAD-dependent oxidoreductase n=1 Tax=unclassified Knoellia TaxID=2618719 RepID=UPI0023D98B65|nr:NAD(P)/FAD-dependent oxidoreductase [Knoellia sp. p5-6-4]MDF2143496.1 NAD(P)/FAD-dependent oxidoreductase [Knoellia sp. p5-6-4]
MADGTYDVVVAGGGLAGSALGGVLARSGLGVLVVEKEGRFRDRIRGELTFPWGHSEALRAGLGEPLEQVGVVPLPVLDFYQDGRRTDSLCWETVSIDALPAVGFSHPRLQEVVLTWSESQGATVLRSAKVVGVHDGDSPTVSVVSDGRAVDIRARLVVGADGKRSGARRWLGADTVTDPEHHWFGGLLVSGARWDDSIAWATTPAGAVAWFTNGADSCRLYVRLTAEQVRAKGVGHDADAFLSFAATFMPEGTLEGAHAAGPVGFFPNSCTWSSRIALGHLVLVGDAAGAVDPTQGLGTSLLFRDVRALSELLLADGDWVRATTEYERQRQAYYDVLRAYDRWCALLEAEVGPEADRRRERNAAARETDPTLGGFATIEARGPDGLVPDETARRVYFGE